MKIKPATGPMGSFAPADSLKDSWSPIGFTTPKPTLAELVADTQMNPDFTYTFYRDDSGEPVIFWREGDDPKGDLHLDPIYPRNVILGARIIREAVSDQVMAHKVYRHWLLTCQPEELTVKWADDIFHLLNLEAANPPVEICPHVEAAKYQTVNDLVQMGILKLEVGQVWWAKSANKKVGDSLIRLRVHDLSEHTITWFKDHLSNNASLTHAMPNTMTHAKTDIQFIERIK